VKRLGNKISILGRFPTKNEFKQFFQNDNIYFDVVTLLLSYMFILFAAWNDDLLGLPSNGFTWLGEYVLAGGLACEIVLRVALVDKRPWHFYPLVALDAISVLTVIPSLIFVTFARVIRLIVSSGRMLQLIDKVSRSRGNPYLILLVYPFVVPIAAALFYALERHASNTQVHNYFQSLVMMMSYSLTVGLAANHPVTTTGKLIAGGMLLTGIMCVSIIGNALTDRYTIVRTEQVETKAGLE